MAIRQIGLLIFLVAMLGACGKTPVQLVTDEEANLGPFQGGKKSLATERGPVIEIYSPAADQVYRKPFPIDVEFKPSPDGHPPVMDSLKLTYQKYWGVDITDRVKPYIKGNKIAVPDADLPNGEHSIEIAIEDSQGNESTKVFRLEVRMDKSA